MSNNVNPKLTPLPFIVNNGNFKLNTNYPGKTQIIPPSCTKPKQLTIFNWPQMATSVVFENNEIINFKV